MAPSWFQILIVVVLLVLLFGRGKISELMGDVAKGIKSFKKGMAEDEDTATTAKTIEHTADETVTESTKTEETKAG
ncbi:MAG: twin-arginine translocase TatA/TatE family subunit [Pseudomonadota bacterium]